MDTFPSATWLDRIERLERRAALFHKNALLANPHAKRASAHVGDLLYHTGNPVIRTHYHSTEASTNTVVQADEDRWDELRSYIERRRTEARDQTVVCGANDCRHIYRYRISK